MATPQSLRYDITTPTPHYVEFGCVSPPPAEIAIAGDRRYTAGAILLREHIANRGPSGSLDFWECVYALHELSNVDSIPCFIANRLGSPRPHRPAHPLPSASEEPISLLQTLEDIAAYAKNRSERLERERAASEFLQALYAGGPEQARSEGIYHMIKWIFDKQERSAFGTIQTVFELADTSRLAPEYLIGLLRTTYVERTMAPGWKEFARRVATELCARNRTDIDELLQGLR